MTLPGTTTPEHVNNSSQGILHIPQSSRTTASLSGDLENLDMMGYLTIPKYVV